MEEEEVVVVLLEIRGELLPLAAAERSNFSLISAVLIFGVVLLDRLLNVVLVLVSNFSKTGFRVRSGVLRVRDLATSVCIHWLSSLLPDSGDFLLKGEVASTALWGLNGCTGCELMGATTLAGMMLLLFTGLLTAFWLGSALKLCLRSSSINMALSLSGELLSADLRLLSSVSEVIST